MIFQASLKFEELRIAYGKEIDKYSIFFLNLFTTDMVIVWLDIKPLSHLKNYIEWSHAGKKALATVDLDYARVCEKSWINQMYIYDSHI